MCKAFSCIVEPNGKVWWKLGTDSHTDLLSIAKLKEYDTTTDPAKMMFARVEITPENENYLHPDKWTLRVDQSITPSWFGEKHKEAANKAHAAWLSKLREILVDKPLIHPFKLRPHKVTAKDVANLKKWSSVMGSIGGSNRARVYVGNYVWYSILDSVWCSCSGLWALRDSVRYFVRAYTDSFFKLKEWKNAEHAQSEYPFQSAVDLCERGFVPSFDGKIWRLHAGKDAKVVFEISKSDLLKS